MKYTVYVTQETKYAIEVEANDPATAESRCWDLMDSDCSTQLDNNATAEYIVDENNVTYNYSRHGRWRAEHRNESEG